MLRVAVAGLLVLALIVSVNAASGSSTEGAPAFADEDPAFVEMMKKVSEETKGQNIYNCIEQITTDPIGLYRVMGTPSQQLFIAKYGAVFSTVSPRIKSQVVHFNEGGAGIGVSLPTGGNNILGVLPGKNLTKWVVIGGHYDTREETAGGAAIDNTSGICTVKEIARVITTLNLELEATMVFAWWDGEEWGLYGSRAFVKNHNDTKVLLGLSKETPVDILAGQSFDIVGINYPAYNTWVRYGEPTNIMENAVLNLRTAPHDVEKFTLCPNYGCYARLKDREDFESVIIPRNTRYHFLVEEIALKFLQLPVQWVQPKDDQYGRSDQVPFIAAGLPGMRIQGSHDMDWPHYHHASDTLPAAVSMAGGQDKLVAGFTTEARVGGLTAIYVAAKGDYGWYGPMEEESAVGVRASPAATSADTPALGLAPLLAAILVVGLLRRRAA